MAEKSRWEKIKKDIKKVLTKYGSMWYHLGVVAWDNNLQNLDNWTIDNNPENFLKERISEQNGTSKRCPTLKQ